MSGGRVHLPGIGGAPACIGVRPARRPTSELRSEDPAAVTCRSCRRTVRFARALETLERAAPAPPADPPAVARKLALWYAIEPTPRSLARLSWYEALRVPTVGRRSLEALQAWLAAAGLELSTSGPPVPLPKGRTVFDKPWRPVAR